MTSAEKYRLSVLEAEDNRIEFQERLKNGLADQLVRIVVDHSTTQKEAADTFKRPEWVALIKEYEVQNAFRKAWDKYKAKFQ